MSNQKKKGNQGQKPKAPAQAPAEGAPVVEDKTQPNPDVIDKTAPAEPPEAPAETEATEAELAEAKAAEEAKIAEEEAAEKAEAEAAEKVEAAEAQAAKEAEANAAVPAKPDHSEPKPTEEEVARAKEAKAIADKEAKEVKAREKASAAKAKVRQDQLDDYTAVHEEAKADGTLFYSMKNGARFGELHADGDIAIVIKAGQFKRKSEILEVLGKLVIAVKEDRGNE